MTARDPAKACAYDGSDLVGVYIGPALRAHNMARRANPGATVKLFPENPDA